MNHQEQATIVEAQVRASKANVQIAGALRDLTAQVCQLTEVVHKMLELLAEREDHNTGSSPD